MMRKNELEDLVSNLLEQKTFEEVLEYFDITPLEVMVIMYNQGMLDEEILEGLNSVYEY